MSWRTNKIAIWARNVGRRSGLNRILAGVLSRRGYEERFHDTFCKHIDTGDCVWDVGANVGHYTQLFSTRVGRDGSVFAFEPSPENFQRLESQCHSLPNVKLLQLGLGRQDGSAQFQQGADGLGATSRVVEGEQTGQSVEIRQGDCLLKQGTVASPNVIKIDVEGLEWDVLQGLRTVISDRCVRAVGVEVHFGLLQERGDEDAPAEIEQELRHAGFDTSWPDASHIIAVRKSA